MKCFLERRKMRTMFLKAFLLHLHKLDMKNCSGQWSSWRIFLGRKRQCQRRKWNPTAVSILCTLWRRTFIFQWSCQSLDAHLLLPTCNFTLRLLDLPNKPCKVWKSCLKMQWWWCGEQLRFTYPSVETSRSYWLKLLKMSCTEQS